MKNAIRKAVTLTELMIVVIIVGILAGVAIPSYLRAKEKTIDKQAQVALGLIRGAERSYGMQLKYYYPATATTITDLTAINGNLSLALTDDGTWSYSIAGGASGGFTATMSRTGWGFDRSWSINNSTVNATCAGNCP